MTGTCPLSPYLIVKYLSYGKNQINGNTNNETHKIKKQIKYIPHSSVSFLYKEKNILLVLAMNVTCPHIQKEIQS
jgi:hypothetical protein